MAVKEKEGGGVLIRRATTAFGAEFALVNIGGRARIIKKAAPWDPPMPIEDFITLQGSKGKKARAWLKGMPAEEAFTGMRMNPRTLEERLPDGCFNTWKGFQVTPSADGTWDLLQEHLLTNLCGGREALYEYVMGWMAHMVQRPWEKPLVALLAYGETHGTGKDTVGKILGDLLHKQNYAHVRGSGQIADEYDGGTMASALFVHAEEVLVEGGKAEVDKLKSWITAPKMRVRFMRTDGYMADNFARLYMTSNHTTPVHVEPSDRRFVAIRVGAHPHTNDLEWFGKLHAELEAGGLRNFLNCLTHWNLEGFEVRKRISTEEHAELKTASMTAPHQFIAECVSGQPKRLTKTETYDKFTDWCKRRGIRSINQIVFGRELAKMGVKMGRQKQYPRATTYEFGDCAKVREELEKLYPSIRKEFDFQPLPVRGEVVDSVEESEDAKDAADV